MGDGFAARFAWHSSVLDKLRRRKNIRVRPIVERYMLLYSEQGILHPMRLDIKRRRVRYV